MDVADNAVVVVLEQSFFEITLEHQTAHEPQRFILRQPVPFADDFLTSVILVLHFLFAT